MNDDIQTLALRDGISIEKGVILTREYLDDNQELFTRYLDLWIRYPDLLLDMIQDQNDAKYFHLMPFQRISLRASMRYRYHFWTATRATSKSFTAYLSAFMRAMLLPNSTIMIVSDTKGTVIKSAEAKFEEIFRHWPLLQKELKTRQDDGKTGIKSSSNYYEIYFKNGSMISVISKDTSRGLRATAAILEECALIEEVPFNEVIWPQMNIKRREVDGSLNPNEPSASQIFITTAAERTVFMYQKLIEITINAVLRPKEYFSWGLSYEIPLHYGLLDKATLMDQRYSTTVSEDSFARESLSIWTGNSKDAWLDSRKLNKHRCLLKCERQAIQLPDGAFYLIGVDVGRYSANTAIMVIKVLPGEQRFKKKVIYTEVINGANYITEQAPRLKKLIQLFHPREIVIDGNGPGIGLMDAMVLPSYDQRTGEQFPAYFTFNNINHLPPELKDEQEEPNLKYNAIIYDIKASASNEDAIHSALLTNINNGSTSFLAHERVVKDKLIQSKKGQRMTSYDRRVYLMPYEMTSRLMDELNNLRLKPTGVENKYKIERISRSIEKDRFSSLEYALYRIKYYEDKEIFKKKKKNMNQYVFFSPKNRG